MESPLYIATDAINEKSHLETWDTMRKRVGKYELPDPLPHSHAITKLPSFKKMTREVMAKEYEAYKFRQ